jgi:hypothetical protein
MPTSLKKKPIGRLGSGILADSIKKSDQGKIDCYGIFTIFHAWGYPCSRSWKAIITIFNLPKGNTSLTVTLKEKSKNIKSLGSVDISGDDPNGVIAIPIPLKYRFNKPGSYYLEFTIIDNLKKLRIPFEVRTKEWPEFTKKEIEFAKNNNLIPQSLRANVHCDKCEYAYIFEETFIPELEPKGGIHRFPESGRFECSGCGQVLELRDIQGQLRASLKDIISQKMRVLE